MTEEPRPCWSTVTDRREAVELQAFTCTTDTDRTPRGRRLPHPRPWEREAQSLLRTTGHTLSQGDALIVGRAPTPPCTIIAAAWLAFHKDETPRVFIRACGVTIDLRRRGGAIANSLIDQVIHTTRQRMALLGAPRIVVHGNVHVHNSPSEDLLLRKMFEPVGAPLNNYQQWARLLTAE